MAMEYSLSIETDLNTIQILEATQAKLGMSLDGETIRGISGMSFDICPRDQQDRGMSWLKKAFGFSPNKIIYMRLEKDLRHEGGIDSVIRLTSAIAYALPCDMLLMFNGEYPYLVRHAGRITLNSQGSEKVKFWNDHAIGLLHSCAGSSPALPIAFEDMRGILG